MKTSAILLILGFVTSMTTFTVQAVDDGEVINIPLSRPGETAFLEIDILSAKIDITGEKRDDAEFIVSLHGSEKKIRTPSGIKTIAGGSFGLEIEEKNNRIEFDADWRSENIDIKGKVPSNTNIDISTINNSIISVQNIVGNLHLENTNGPISAHNISGTVIAEALNEDINVSFTEVSQEGVSSLSSLNGDITLTLSENASVDLYIDTFNGEIESEFEVALNSKKPKEERHQLRNGVSIKLENSIIAEINGGGPIIKLNTLNGDIIIKKAQ